MKLVRCLPGLSILLSLRPLERDARITPLIATLLASRGIRDGEEAQQFLHPKLTDLHSPYAMHGMDAAVPAVRSHRAQGAGAHLRRLRR